MIGAAQEFFAASTRGRRRAHFLVRNCWLLILVSFATLVGCGDQPAGNIEATATTSSATSAPTEPIVAAPTASPAATLPPPAVNPATVTPVPLNSPTSAPEATATPEGVSLLTAEAFGDDRNRLTGEQVDDPAVLQRRPIACKLSNFPANYTRPQSGSNDADLLFEHMTEFGLTRFTAIFYGTAPPNIGPIRSARLIDVELPAMYDAALCFSGASTGVSQRLFRTDFSDRILRANETGYYRTGANVPYEHTFYARPEGLWQALENRGENRAPSFDTQMAFSSLPPLGGEPATSITVDYRSELVNWRYDPANGRYWRWSDGEVHRDANTGEQLNFQNVVVVKAIQVDDGTICEQITNGVCAALSVQIQLWGQGEAIIFRDGLMYRGTWHRANRNDMLTFTDAAGDPIPLQIGNTFFQVMPANLEGYPLTVE